MSRISEIDLIFNSDGSVYHLHLLPDEVADTIITVGDPGRVEKISKYFDTVEVVKSNREFITHTGLIGGKRLSVISTGIGTGNIDIVLNEVDALVNIDFSTRLSKRKKKSLRLIRIGTSGSLQVDVPIDSILVSTEAIGLDSLLQYYQMELTSYERDLLNDFKNQVPHQLNPYIASASEDLLGRFGTGISKGITLTTPGFFAPQGRQLNGRLAYPDLLDTIAAINICGRKITNFEMETSALYGLARCLGHQAVSVNVILPNRSNNLMSTDPDNIIDKAIRHVISKIF